ncbi:MAG: shikimate kinase [Clostridia bacterium]|nr:shikimate kinase [Clostridia bacterium]
MQNNIVLCGFMGCGKSTVGKLLANRLNFTFCDSDFSIEQREGCSISEIFSRHGEEHFRATEKEVVKELSAQKGLVIATGGGVVINPDNAENLRKTGLVIFLDVTPETVLKRLEGDTTRPLLMRDDKETAVRELLNCRKPIYKTAAHFTVDANHEAQKTVEEIIGLYRSDSL